MKTTKTKCFTCGKNFEKRNSDYNRCEREGRRHFCSLKCSATYSNKNRSEHNIDNLKPDNRQDEFSAFRCFLRRAKQTQRKTKRAELLKIDIDLPFLKELWESQKGICPYTGHKMILPKNMLENRNSLYYASLDRIDSSVGYIKGNVEFVCQGVNYAKNGYSKEETMGFFNTKR